MTVYLGSDGRTYTPSEVVEELEEGAWESCIWRTDTDHELVKTGDGELLMLVPERELDDVPPLHDGDDRRADRPTDATRNS
jgi:hypothetical protein